MAINRITRDDVGLFRTVAELDHTNLLNEYQRIATKSAIYPGQGTPLGLIYVALKLNGESGELAEHVGKAMRDDGLMEGGPDRPAIVHTDTGLTVERHTAIVKELGDVLWYLSAAANELGMTLADVALANLRKLADRSERDALRGSGDNR